MSITVPLEGFGGGGGASLNFDVKAYSTEEALLAATPKENTIGIITTTPITSWMFASADTGETLQSGDLYTTDDMTADVYLEDDGSETSNDTYYTTKYIQLPTETTSLIATFEYTNEDVIAFYDSDKNFISTLMYEEGTATYSVPSNACYIRVSYHYDYEAPTIYANYTVYENAAEGAVRISTGTASTIEFNALKKNAIQVYPLSAKQYVGGEWANVPAMSYQGGEWVEWTTYLYEHGDECDHITGGWVVLGNVDITVDRNINNMYVSMRGTAATNTYGGIVTKNKINLTSFSKITVNDDILDGYDSVNGKTIGLCLYSTLPTSHTEIVSNRLANVALVGGNQLDISGVSGSYYVAISVYLPGMTSYYVNVNLREMKVE